MRFAEGVDPGKINIARDCKHRFVGVGKGPEHGSRWGSRASSSHHLAGFPRHRLRHVDPTPLFHVSVRVYADIGECAHSSGKGRLGRDARGGSTPAARAARDVGFLGHDRAPPDIAPGLHWHDRGDCAKPLSVYERLDTSNTERSLLSGMSLLLGEGRRRACEMSTAAERDAGPGLRLWVGLIAARDGLNDRELRGSRRGSIARGEHRATAVSGNDPSLFVASVPG